MGKSIKGRRWCMTVWAMYQANSTPSENAWVFSSWLTLEQTPTRWRLGLRFQPRQRSWRGFRHSGGPGIGRLPWASIRGMHGQAIAIQALGNSAILARSLDRATPLFALFFGE